MTEVRDHDLRGQLIYQSLGSADTRVYGYDPNGNLTQQQRLPAVSNYGYDRLDRLASETDTQTTLGYTYDGNGNRVSASLNTLGATLNYEANTNRLTSLTIGSTTEPLTLDPAGNLTSLFNGRITLTYNNAGRLSALRSGTTTLARYTYNHLGQRTRKATGTATVYHYDLNGNLIAETQPNGTPIRAYLYAEDLPLAQITKAATESLVYLHVDHPGTPRLATDATPRVVWRWEADAFGALPPNTDPDGDGKRTVINLRFAGQYFDGESGLYYNWNRYYSPALGRYISEDPIGLAGGMNVYSYVGNAPLTYTDPTGLLLAFHLNEFSRDPIPRQDAIRMSNFTNRVALTAVTAATLAPTMVTAGPPTARFAITQTQLAIIRNPVLVEQGLAIGAAAAIPGPPDLSQPASPLGFFLSNNPRVVAEAIVNNITALHGLAVDRLADLLFGIDRRLSGCPAN